MRVLLDENVPVQLRRALPKHSVRSVNDVDVGWRSIKNGALLDAMEGSFDLLVTADGNLYAQQRLSGRPFSILVLPTNRRRAVLALGERIAQTIDTISTGEYVVLEPSGDVHRRSFNQST